MMKKIAFFCLNCFLFVVTMFFSSYICEIVLINRIKAFLPNFGGSEIYMSILKSKKKVNIRKLLIGDSTANQFFFNGNDDDEFYSLACNQAIGLCGHFFLLNNFLKTGNRPDEVYFLFTPSSFGNNLNQIYTYHYFLKPFNNSEYKPLMTEGVVRQIKKIPFYYFSQLPFIISPAWAPDYQPPKNESFLSPISIEYLEKILLLQEKYGFRLYVVPSLVPQSNEKLIADYNINEVVNRKLVTYLDCYLGNVHFLPDSCFKDKVHLLHPMDYRNDILKNMEKVKTNIDSVMNECE